MSIQHKDIPDAQLHEVKGAASATSGQVLVANGSGGATFQTFDDYIGWWNYDDDATATTPINLTLANTQYDLTNDTVGVSTITTYGFSGVTPWNVGTSRLDFTGFDVGDTLDLRVDVLPTTTGANHEITIELEIGIGSPVNFTLPLARVDYKTAGTYKIVAALPLFIGSADIRNSPARITAKSDATGDSVVVNGWYIKAYKGSIG